MKTIERKNYPLAEFREVMQTLENHKETLGESHTLGLYSLDEFSCTNGEFMKKERYDYFSTDQSISDCFAEHLLEGNLFGVEIDTEQPSVSVFISDGNLSHSVQHTINIRIDFTV